MNEHEKNLIDKEKFYTMKELVNRLRVDYTTIYKWIDEGTFPQPAKRIGRIPLWLKNEVEEWIKKKAEREKKKLMIMKKIKMIHEEASSTTNTKKTEAIKCPWCGRIVIKTVHYYISYHPPEIIEICKDCYDSLPRPPYSVCYICGECKEKIFECFALVDPQFGLSYWDEVIDPNTGKFIHPWAKRGTFVKLCEDCIKKAIGIIAVPRKIITVQTGEKVPIETDEKKLEQQAREIQKNFSVNIEQAKKEWVKLRLEPLMWCVLRSIAFLCDLDVKNIRIGEDVILEMIKRIKKEFIEVLNVDNKKNLGIEEDSKIKVYRLRDLTKLLNVSHTTIYRWIREGKFPKPIRFRKRFFERMGYCGWFKEDIENWLKSKKQS